MAFLGILGTTTKGRKGDSGLSCIHHIRKGRSLLQVHQACSAGNRLWERVRLEATSWGQ